MGRVFISHSSTDDIFVEKLVADLEQVGIETFVDHRDIKLAKHWNQEVDKALSSCDQMIAVISAYSCDSTNCQNEWYSFINEQKEVIPIWLGGKMYFQFMTCQWVDFRKDYEPGINQLVDYLNDKIVNPVILNVPPRDANSPLAAKLAVTYPLLDSHKKWIGVATGNIAEIVGADVLVNSENSLLKMDNIAGKTVSGALNTFGAQWEDYSNPIYTIELELDAERQRRGLKKRVPPATTIVTSGGSLYKNHVRHIVHVVTVECGMATGVRPYSRVKLSRCVRNVLLAIDELNAQQYPDDPLRSVVFPLFGTGEGGKRVEDIALLLIERAIDYLETENTQIEAIYFLAYRQKDMDILTGILNETPDLGNPV